LDSLKVSLDIKRACVSPDVIIVWWYGLLEELELIEVEDNEVSTTEDGHQDTHAAEDECV